MIRTDFLQSYARRFVAIILIFGFYGLAKLPELSDTERAELASQFRFTRLPISELSESPAKFLREVHPSLEHISAWISSVGAAIALNDLDGDGLSNDLCYVDTRRDQVVITPVPGTAKRYEPFALDPAPLSYDSATMAPMGCLPGDLNEDGAIDLIVYYWGRTPIAFLHKGEEKNVSIENYMPYEIVPDGGRWFTNAATLADLDGDGHVDLIIGNYFQDNAEILDAHAGGLEEMQHSMSRAFNGGVNRILLWSDANQGTDPTVSFKEVKGILDEQVAQGWTLAVAAADLDGDLLPEIYFANDFGPDRLLHNRSSRGVLRFALLNGEKGLTTPSSMVLGNDSFKGMGVDFGDLNGDGILDIYVSNIAEEYALEESHLVYLSTGELDKMQDEIAPYVDRGEALGLSRSGWGWDAKLADFNNDGILEAIQATGFVKGRVNRWPELHQIAMGNDELLSHASLWPRVQPGDDLSGHQHNPFFVKAKDGRYYDLAEALGLTEPQVTRGIAIADVDGDGDLDYAVGNQWDASRFYRNDSPDAGRFLGLHLLLPLHPANAVKTSIRSGHPGRETKGRPAIGATAIVHLPDGRRLVAQVDGGNGHSGVRSPDLHFGLDQVPPDTSLTIDLSWRDSDGAVHQETFHLKPGWHTLLLGGSRREAT